MKTGYILLIALPWIFSTGCKNLNNARVSIVLDSIVIDSVPFLQQEMVSFPDTGKHFELKGIDSVVAFNVILQLADGNIMTKLPPLLHDSVLMVAGIRRRDKEIVVMLDTNNDKKINDEKIYAIKNVPYQLVKNLEYFDGIRIRKSDFFMKPIVSSIRIEKEGGQNANASKPFEDPSVIVRANYRLGTFRNDEALYKIALFNYLWPEYDKENSYMVAVPASNPFPDPKFGVVYYKPGDVFYLGEKSYKFIDLAKDGSSVKLEQIPFDKRKPGVDSSYSALNIEGNDLLTGSLYNLADSKKYTLLDFWGTWCSPCIATIPKLKSLNEDRKQYDLQIVSIAYDDDVEKVKQKLRREAISWTNLFDDNTKSIIVEKYRVRAFPTFILIDPDGKIVKRGSSEATLDKIITYLQTKR